MADSLRFDIPQGDLLPAIEAVAFKVSGPVDFTSYTGGVTFRMLKGSTVVIASGVVTSDDLGNLSYQWQSGETAVSGTYSGRFHGIDGAGRRQSFPTVGSITIVIGPADP